MKVDLGVRVLHLLGKHKIPKRIIKQKVQARFWTKVEFTSKCWFWRGTILRALL